jgi:hypothetical protein
MPHDEPMAVLFSYDPDTGETTGTPLVGIHDDGSDPITWAFALRDSIRGDFPEHVLWSVTGNTAAKNLRSDFLTDQIMGRRD